MPVGRPESFQDDIVGPVFFAAVPLKLILLTFNWREIFRAGYVIIRAADIDMPGVVTHDIYPAGIPEKGVQQAAAGPSQAFVCHIAAINHTAGRDLLIQPARVGRGGRIQPVGIAGGILPCAGDFIVKEAPYIIIVYAVCLVAFEREAGAFIFRRLKQGLSVSIASGWWR